MGAHQDPVSNGQKKFITLSLQRRKREKSMKTLKISADNEISIIDVNFDDFKSIQKALGGHFETVHTAKMSNYFQKPVIMLVDEDGHFKNLPLNRFGSWMYDMPRHGSPILGDALLAEARYEDIMAVQEPEKLMEKLLNDFEFLKKEKR